MTTDDTAKTREVDAPTDTAKTREADLPGDTTQTMEADSPTDTTKTRETDASNGAGPAPRDVPHGLRGLARRVGALGQRSIKDFAYLMVGLATGTAFFSISVTLISLSAGLLVLIIGIPVAMLSSEILRWCAELERKRTLLVDPEPVRGHYRSRPQPSLTAAGQMVADPRRWKDVAYSIVQFPVSVVAFCCGSLWAASAAYLLMPAWYWAIPNGGPDIFGIPGSNVDSLGKAFLATLIGIALIPVAYWLSRGATIVSVGLTRALLGDERAELKQRVSHLEETRAGAVDAASSELKRIERDLHDGAQARMVAVAMDLGMAEERITDDPAAARELIQGARSEARRALAEMRDLVRGIAPSVLADRGLTAALGSLVGRAPVPTLLDIDLPERPPMTAETAAYFVVSEALANVAKHATAASCEIMVRMEDTMLEVRIVDDGAGGAQAHPGGGLEGLRDRVAALDGTLEISSPLGGPTTLEARIPCGS